MADQWFYESGGKSQGPVDRAALERFVREGAVGKSTLVWTEGLADWRPASAVEGLLPTVAAPSQEDAATVRDLDATVTQAVRPAPASGTAATAIAAAPPTTPAPPAEATPAAATPAPTAPRAAGGRSRRGVLRDIGAKISEVADLPTISRVPVKDILVGGLQKKTRVEDIEEIFAAGTAATTPAQASLPAGWPTPRVFWRVLGGAVATFLLLRLGWTEFQNPNFLPGMIFVGSFVVPLSVVFLFFELNTPRNVSIYQVGKMLLLGGALSLVATMIVFQFVTGAGTGQLIPAMLTGLGEELGKAAALLVIVYSPRYPYQMNGLLFGAAVGAGFAGFESAGYAFNVGIAASATAKFTVDSALDNVMLRAVLAPGGHVIWTAMVASAIWKAKAGKAFELALLARPVVLRRFAIATVLHGLWDTSIRGFDWRIQLAILIVVGWYLVLAVVKQSLDEVEAEAGKRRAAASS
jgi:RsiW-degrading membrane proteinase PrsW (M82 family)